MNDSIRDEPAPRGPALMRMTWLDLLFAHWPLAPEAIRPLVPAELEIDTWDGKAWIGVVPFRMAGVTAARLPPIPRLSRLDELNVRTYVRHAGRAGVWFFSLDATSRLAVWSARLVFGLPYQHASIAVSRTDAGYAYSVERSGDGRGRFDATYRPTSAPRPPEPGSFEAWLVDRPRLFALHRGRIERTEIDHPRWPLQAAEAEIRTNTIAGAAGIELPSIPPHLAFSKRVDVRGWAPVRS